MIESLEEEPTQRGEEKSEEIPANEPFLVRKQENCTLLVDKLVAALEQAYEIFTHADRCTERNFVPHLIFAIEQQGVILRLGFVTGQETKDK